MEGADRGWRAIAHVAVLEPTLKECQDTRDYVGGYFDRASRSAAAGEGAFEVSFERARRWGDEGS
jgi:predicted transcriptional regulator of viral defense system